MRQQHHVVAWAAAGQPTSPGEIAALADAEHSAQAMDGELRFRPSMSANLIDFPPGRNAGLFQDVPLLAKGSFSRRSRSSSAVTSLSAAEGSTARRSGLRPTQRTSVDRPIPRSPAISRCVRPLVCTGRTASSANSFVNRRCCIFEFLFSHGELSTFTKQVQVMVTSVKWLTANSYFAPYVETPTPNTTMSEV
jgi:hypothetical protein